VGVDDLRDFLAPAFTEHSPDLSHGQPCIRNIYVPKSPIDLDCLGFLSPDQMWTHSSLCQRVKIGVAARGLHDRARPRAVYKAPTLTLKCAAESADRFQERFRWTVVVVEDVV
jgi:hypothetical protein